VKSKPLSIQRDRLSYRLLVVLCALTGWSACRVTAAQATSAPAILQFYEARWNTIEDRMADVFVAGYGQMWVPPPEKAGLSGSNVGYEVFDRFDLGSPKSPTLYGTEEGLKACIAAAHAASVKVYTDFVSNHNGFLYASDAKFVAEGGYPGFVMALPDDPFGDFHDPRIKFEQDPYNGALLGLLDIAQEKNHVFIRNPVMASNPLNIPAGTIYNKPDPNNSRFYPDHNLGGLVLNDPVLGGTVTRYRFNLANPSAGDATPENALGLLMRNAQWMIEVTGADGFRVDAARHMPTEVLNHFDQAVFRANPRLNLDGSIQPTFMFCEIYHDDKKLIQGYVRKDLPNPVSIEPSDTTIRGNRDVLDFPLFFALRDNLSANSAQNNWHNVHFASMDSYDKVRTDEAWACDGSEGVSFVDSHDNLVGGFPFLRNVAYAYTLMRPGNAIVYLNAREFGNDRAFPHDEAGPMSNDALGGIYGDAITKLVGIRNTHGRGNFRERWIDEAFEDLNGDGQKSNVYVYERENSAIVALSNRLDDGHDERSPIQTSFAPGTVLIELTGNAADPLVNPDASIPRTIRVDADGRVKICIPRNASHGRGYVIYGVANPQGSLSLADISRTLPGAAPSAHSNGTARQSDIDVVSGNSFTVRLNTSPVTLPPPAGESDPVRDIDADGDTAMLRLDEGIDVNGNGVVDDVKPGSVTYGFENFSSARTPGYISNGKADVGTGAGNYEQVIDTSHLSEGRHYLTVRVFRHRDAATGGDGGPAVFTDFRRTIYVDHSAPITAAMGLKSSDDASPNSR
jgi:glycosidase